MAPNPDPVLQARDQLARLQRRLRLEAMAVEAIAAKHVEADVRQEAVCVAAGLRRDVELACVLLTSAMGVHEPSAEERARS